MYAPFVEANRLQDRHEHQSPPGGREGVSTNAAFKQSLRYLRTGRHTLTLCKHSAQEKLRPSQPDDYVPIDGIRI
jgi:hypothetical protein